MFLLICLEASSVLSGLCKAAEESGQLVYDNAPGSEKYVSIAICNMVPAIQALLP